MEIDLKQAQLRNMLSDPLQREEGFRKLMQTYGDKLYWHIRRIVVGHDDAEDVLQETCIKIISGIDSFRGEGQLTTWIYSIATNESLRHLRRQPTCFKASTHWDPCWQANSKQSHLSMQMQQQLLSRKHCLRCPLNSVSLSICATSMK